MAIEDELQKLLSAGGIPLGGEIPAPEDRYLSDTLFPNFMWGLSSVGENKVHFVYDVVVGMEIVPPGLPRLIKVRYTFPWEAEALGRLHKFLGEILEDDGKEGEGDGSASD